MIFRYLDIEKIYFKEFIENDLSKHLDTNYEFLDALIYRSETLKQQFYENEQKHFFDGLDHHSF